MSHNLISLGEFGKAFIPKSIRPRLRRYLAKAGYEEVPYRQYGFFFVFSVFVTGVALVGFIFPYIQDLNSLLFMLLTFVFWVAIQSAVLFVIVMLLYIHLDIKIYRRTKNMEAVLEDFLRYLSENLKGGMTFERALWRAIKPQFGILAKEISLVAKRVVTGQDVKDALMEFTEKYDSPILKRSFQLIVEGMKGGGNVAYIIDKVEKDIRETKELKQEMAAANTTYVIFIVAIVLIIAPALFGLSYNLLLVLQEIGGTISNATSSGSSSFSMMDLSDISIDPASFRMFSMGALTVISFFSSLILSIIRKGNMKDGVKYIPIFIGVSVLMYLFFRTVLSYVFSGFI
ncbi:MAG: type II secretion system F family protein [Nanobdellota archaeon]